MKNNQSGMAAIFTVLIISAAALLMAKSTSLLGMDALEIQTLANGASETLFIADGCIEESLRRLRINESWSASGLILNIGAGSCEVNTEELVGRKKITAVSTLNNYHKKVAVEVTTADGEVNVLSWKEE